MSDLSNRLAALSPAHRRLLAQRLKHKERSHKRPPIVPIARTTDLFPLSFMQEHLWFVDQLTPGSPIYNLSTALRYVGALRYDALVQALTTIVRRHEALRTTFVRGPDDQPRQRINPSQPIVLPVADLTTLPAALREDEARRLALAEALRPFDLSCDQLLRGQLLRLSETEHIHLITMHHIVTDGWSSGIFVRELAALYAAYALGQSAAQVEAILPPLPIQYVDFAVWQRQSLHDQRLEHQLTYWREELADTPTLLELPTDRPRPPVPTAGGSTQTLCLDATLTAALHELSQQEGATLFMTLLTGFAVLLHRYTNQTDILIGSPIAGREHAETQGLIGFFVNMLVLRARLGGNPSVREALGQMRQAALRAYEHQDVPFEMLVGELRPERSLSYTPMFQVVFALHNTPMQPLQLTDVTVHPPATKSGVAAYDLCLELTEEDGGLRAVLEYSTDLFDAPTIARLLGHYQTVLTAMVADPDQPIAHLPLLTEPELQQLAAWNATARPYAEHQGVHQLVEAQVEQTPDAIAVVADPQQLSYRELNTQANRLAHYLRALGVGPDVLVGVYLERSLDLPIALLAVLKAGGAYIALDPANPPARLTWMLDDAGASLLLTTHVLHASIPTDGVQIVCLDTALPQLVQQPTSNPLPVATADHLAYVIYTSGSTGTPKGVMISHRALYNHTVWLQRLFPLNATDAVLQKAPVGFDASVLELYAPLVTGARLVMARPGGHQDSQYLVEAIRRHSITFLLLVPSMLRLVLEEPMFTACTSLRHAFCGGEALPMELVERFSALSSATLGNFYGPTETTIDATFWHCTPEDHQHTAPIGRPIDNTQVFVLGPQQQLLPIGVPGELYIGGDGHARGYLNRPQLTAEKFIPNPFAERNAQQRLYRTGDLVRYRSDGVIEFLGRIDHQVKIRGCRIEIGEIESMVRQHPDIQDAVVLVRQDRSGTLYLVAYIVAATPAPSSEAVRHFLKQYVPDYMVPSIVIPINGVPLTANGKIDREALPEPHFAPIDADADYVAPQTPYEELLAELWAALLGVARVGVDDNFFDLGGHSLLASQLAARLRAIYQVDLPLHAIFEQPTLGALAAYLATLRRTAQIDVMPPLRSVTRDEPLPTSFSQRRLWFLDQLEGDSPIYAVPTAFRLSGPLDPSALEQALSCVVERHEVLRTTFAAAAEPIQVIHPPHPITIPVIDLPSDGRDIQAAAAQRIIVTTIEQPFDLSRGPLVRALLLRYSPTDHVLLLVLHHSITDGWSTTVLLNELAALYPRYAAGEVDSAGLPPLALQYADFAVWQRQALQGDMLAAHRDYWGRHLEGASTVLNLPTDRPRPPAQTFQGALQTCSLSLELAQKLQVFNRHEGLTLFMTLLAGFQILLHRYTGQADILVGTPIANRTRAELEPLIGCFVNTLVLRAHVGDNPTARELLRRVRESALGAYAHQDYPFELLVEQLQPERNLSYTPLVQVLFVLHNTPSLPSSFGALAVEALPNEGAVAKFDLSLAVTERNGAVTVTAEYNTDLFDASTIARLLGHYQTILTTMVAEPDQQIGHIALLTEPELQQFAAWNATAQPYSDDHCVHQLIEAQVERTPNAIAVVAGTQQVSYAELNARANQLARYLRRYGVGPEVPVGLCVDHSVDLLVALLAIFKAGGAYLPLDPTYPRERLTFMLQDARVPLLLTQTQFAARLPDVGAHVIRIDADWPEIAQQPSTNLPLHGDVARLAYVIYTSGSTGLPKGVQITQRSVVNLLQTMRAQIDITADDVMPGITSPSFDISVSEFFLPLLCGARLVLVSRALIADGLELLALLSTMRATVVQATPATWRLLFQAGWPTTMRFRVAITTGEALTIDVAEQLLLRAEVLWNCYGPTETTVWSTLQRITSPEQASLIGRPLANTTVYVLDRQRQPVPVGVPGELYIGGAGLARGYLNRPELTAQAFIPNPWVTGQDRPISGPSTLPASSDRLYRTGDLVRMCADGTLEFLGRIDHQVKIRGYRIELSEIENELRQCPELRDVAVVAREDAPGDKRLVAYVVAREQGLSADTLQRQLQQHLPAYMIPTAFVELDALPLTPNGKLDRRALPAPEWNLLATAKSFVAPRTDIEAHLAAVWSQVLRLEQVGIYDNFFALGGDSILSMQIVARAMQAGLRLTPRQLFQYQTIAELATVVNLAPVVTAPQELITGPVLLTPIQHWFFEQQVLDPQHWNQAVLVAARQRLDIALLEQAVAQLYAHHDALRLRFALEDGRWQQVNAGCDTPVPVRHVDLSAVSSGERRAAIAAIAAATQVSLDLATGPLMQVALLDLGQDEAMHLLIVIHHLAVDGVSWRILLEDLQTVYVQLSQDQPLQLAPKTTSFQQWAAQLTAYAQTTEARAELNYWLAQPWNRVESLPAGRSADLPAPDNTEGAAQAVTVALSAQATDALLHTVPAAYHAHINDILITALAQTFAGWTGQRTLLVDLEGHGREDLFADVDLSRTVGWFTSLFPAILELGAADRPAESLKAVKEQLRAIPQRGLSYGVLRYLSAEPDIKQQLEQLPAAELCFNYLGQMDQGFAADGLFDWSRAESGPARSPRAQRAYLLEILGIVVEGQLQLTWRYAPHWQPRATIERLAATYLEQLRALITLSQSHGSTGCTPSDFPLVQLSQDQLDHVVSIYPKLEDVYPLSSLQQGMLFHSLYTPTSSVYVEQFNGVLRGPLRVAELEQAWNQTIRQHSVLRTSFAWQGLDVPLQIVHRDVRLPLAQYDWQALTQHQQQTQLDAWLAADRDQAFDLTTPPLMRLTLMRLAPDRYHLTWSFHHALLDGWSCQRVLSELFNRYAALCAQRPLLMEHSRPYRDYIAWLQQQDMQQAELFWRRQLDGFHTPTPLVIDRPREQPHADATPLTQSKEHMQLSTALTTALYALSQRHHITLSTIIYGCWAVLLHRYSQTDDVLFGTVVSSRPAELAGIEKMIGLFINSLPLRVHVPAEESTITWLQRLQAQAAELRQHDYCSLVDIKGWSSLPREQSLFESIVVFENYPLTAAVGEQDGEVTVENINSIERTNYPLTLVATPTLSLELLYDQARFDTPAMSRMLGHLQALLDGIVSDPLQPIAALPLFSEAEHRQLLVTFNATAQPYPDNQNVHQLVEAQVRQTPDAVAILADSGRLTYRELNGRANRLAHMLRRHGVGSETPVGVVLERTPEMIVVLLAILKAGGAYLPLDPSYPRERLAFMLRDAQVRIVVTQRTLAASVPDLGEHRIVLEDAAPLLAQQPTDDLPNWTQPDHLAYIMYTSGSTGTPKGVMTTHRGIVRLLCSIDYAQLDAAQTLLHLAPTSFDASTFEIWGALLHGGRCALLAERLPSVSSIGEAIRRFGVTTLWLTATLFNSVIDAAPDVLAPVRQLLIGGEALSVQHVTRALGHLPNTRIINGYGPTESTTFACCYPIPRALDADATAVPIGRPIANTTVYLLDRQHRLVPVGVPGELYIGGDGLARGYLNRPELTAECFVPNPFGGCHAQRAPGEPGSRLYKTGDLARFRPDGTIEFLGRRDRQVKLRGFRIELDEIACTLRQHPAVRDVAVVVRYDTPGDSRLVAYVVGAPSAGSQESGTLHPELEPALRQFLQARFPEYMLPAAFVALDALPLTPNGKLDHAALPAPQTIRSQPGISYSAPETLMEQLIAVVWEETLGISEPGIDDNFFELGGHSLHLVKIQVKLQEMLEHDVLLVDLVRNPTIKSLAQHLSHADDAPPSLQKTYDRAEQQKESFQRQRKFTKKRR
jgi:amino acid adenylation domain-containing protein/non-ribosomal peptide synthase protein (TIGR01720 family)